MFFDAQPILENDRVILRPLLKDDFDALYKIASDPKVWEQHPNRDRWKKDVFEVFFEGAIQSKGAFKVIDKSSGEIIGSTRIYDYHPKNNSVLVGYTFYGVQHWGKGVNLSVKAMMLDYLFRFVDEVNFHIGAGNVRSQMAIGRLGATKVGEEELAYHGEASKLNFVYRITKNEWNCRK